MPLQRIIYYSQPNISGISDIDVILSASRRRNDRANITGMLLFNSDWFLQVLEGGRQELSDTLMRIGVDARHSDMAIVSCEEIPSRLFFGWTMRYAALSNAGKRDLLRFAPGGVFDPRTMSARSITDLCAMLAQQEHAQTEQAA